MRIQSTNQFWLWIARLLLAIAFLSPAGIGNAADVKLLSAEIMRHAISELTSEFERTTGHKLTISYNSAGAVMNRIQGGETMDVAIIQRSAVEALSEQGKIAHGSIVSLARSGLGLAVPKGAPKPDISSVDAVKRSLLAAKSIAYPEPTRGAAAGVYFLSVIERLGIAQEVNAKAKLGSPDVQVEAELTIGQPADILTKPRLDFVGWLPDVLQDYNAFTWAAGISSNAKEPDAAKALIQFLSSPTAAVVIRKKGMEPAFP